MEVNYRSLNKKFFSDEKYDEVYKKLKDGLPMTRAYKDFSLNTDKEIIYTPLDFIVVKPSEIDNILAEEYKNDNALGKGITLFYKYITQRYIGITRENVKQFLINQPNYQLTLRKQRIISKPIIAQYPNQKWQIDLIDMNQYVKNNKNFRYILNCVDIFSRKIWMRPLKKKESTNTKNSLENIITNINIKPKLIQVDNGLEFLGEFKQYCDDNSIKIIYNQSYNPNQNSVVERSNEEVRKIIRAYMLQNKNNIWYNLLPKVEENRNDGYNENLKATPNQLWSDTNKPLSKRSLPKTVSTDSQALTSKINQTENAKQVIEKYKNNDNFKVGDKVRILMSSLFSNIRREYKSGNSKKIIVKYSPTVYSIDKVIHKTGLLERNKYVVKNINDEILTLNSKPKQFYASELLVASDENPKINMKKALLLNGVKTTSKDVEKI